MSEKAAGRLQASERCVHRVCGVAAQGNSRIVKGATRIEEVVGLESDTKGTTPDKPLARGANRKPSARYGRDMSVADHRRFSLPGFAIEDMWVGVFSAKMLASGFGQVGDGRSFAFRIEGQWLLVEIYRARLKGPVPQPEEIDTTLRCNIVDVDIADERSLVAAVRDAIALAEVAN